MVRFITFLAKSFVIDEIDGVMSFYGAPPKSIMIPVMGDLKEDGIGEAYVDGVRISKPVLLNAVGNRLLIVPVGEVAREYDRSYTVEFKGFIDGKGKTIRDKKFKIRTKKKKTEDISFRENDEKTLIAARESMILLKNDQNVLPLKKDETLNLFGDISTFRITAFGAPKINPRWSPDLRDAIRDYSDFKLNNEVCRLYEEGKIVVPAKEDLKKAKAESDVAIIYLTRKSGENVDNRPIKGEYYLRDEEREMIKAVCSVFEKTVLILNCGYPIEMGFIDEYGISSVLYTGFSGMLGSYALMEILDGRTNPSGKLPLTFPYDYYDTPASRNFVVPAEGEPNPEEKDGGILTYYCEDIYVGYRYFDSFGKDYAYGFGHGLSYTNFQIGLEEANRNDEGIDLKVKVTNTGKYPGKQAVQVYCSYDQDQLETVHRSLCGFEKTEELQQGASEILDIHIDKFALTCFSENRYLIPQGKVSLWIGDSLADAKEAYSYQQEEEETIKEVSSYGSPVEDFPVLSKEHPEIPSLSKMTEYENRFPVKKEKKVYAPAELPEYKGKTIVWDEVKKDPQLLDKFIGQMSLKELCTLNCNGGNHWMPWQDGCAGALPKLKKYGIRELEVSDANAGVNIKKANIGFPQSSSIAATFNKKIAYMVGETIARESHPYGIVINLGPGFNIQRNILNGRNSEYFSEDPYLSGTMAGYHGKGLEDNDVGSTYKHLFANNAETLRKTNQSIVSERALREIYFKNFEYAMRVHKPVAVMNSYNSMNGIYPAESSELMIDYVRKELGFDGIIMTDWDSYNTIDPVEIVKAGSNWLSSGGKKYARILYEAAKQGKIAKAVLQDNVRHVTKAFMSFDR